MTAVRRPLSTGTTVLRVLERNTLTYRQLWMPLLAGFVEPVFYLLGLGVGVGALVGDIEVDGQTVDYATYVVPGMIAASAMNGALFEATFNFFYKLRYSKMFDTLLTAPMRLVDILIGEAAFAVLRGAVYAAAFVLVAAVLGLTPSPWVIATIPAALLIGLAFSAVGYALTTFLRTWHDFDYVNLVIQPLFLASTTFFPLDVYPGWAQPIVQATPLYHGVALCRNLTLGSPGLADVGHAAYLVALGLGCLLVAQRRLGRMLAA